VRVCDAVVESRWSRRKGSESHQVPIRFWNKVLCICPRLGTLPYEGEGGVLFLGTHGRAILGLIQRVFVSFVNILLVTTRMIILGYSLHAVHAAWHACT